MMHREMNSGEEQLLKPVILFQTIPARVHLRRLLHLSSLGKLPKMQHFVHRSLNKAASSDFGDLRWPVAGS